MVDPTGKPSAHSYSAGMSKQVGDSPVHWGDKCFLCGAEIGEADPRQFYQGRSSIMLCHTGCLNVMNANGGDPADYHRASSGTTAAAAQAPPPGEPGGTGLDFGDLAALAGYVKRGGPLPDHVRVTVGGVVIQEGRGA